MPAGIRETLVITTPRDCDVLRSLLGAGAQWGICPHSTAQERTEGIAQAFLIDLEPLSGECGGSALGIDLGGVLEKRR